MIAVSMFADLGKAVSWILFAGAVVSGGSRWRRWWHC